MHLENHMEMAALSKKLHAEGAAIFHESKLGGTDCSKETIRSAL